MKHIVIRSSPKGQAFIGYCPLCGTTDLTIKDAMVDCANVIGATQSEAMAMV